MTAHRAPVLEVYGLGIHRGNTVILENVSWRVERGQHWAILGANGSGKTSLLGALTGYLTPSRGEISLLKQRYGRTDWRELRRRIGLVSSSIRQRMPDEEPALETVVTGKYAMIDLWGRVTKPDRRDAGRILKQIECAHLADRPWGFLSQGERQRVLIGRSLMARPRVLILDEPCAGLDPVAREHFLDFVNRLGQRRSGPTLILVTHHVEEIVPSITHILLLKAGRVAAAGPKAKVLVSRRLSDAFASRVRIRSTGDSFRLVVSPAQGRVL